MGGEIIAIVPQRGQVGNVCDIETENHRNSPMAPRVTVSRDRPTEKAPLESPGSLQ